ncbi:MAG: cryptochrome/photolyase family protein [Bacteroidota bacterium]|jgi:deoxyribodipyrimidine photo-lyase
MKKKIAIFWFRRDLRIEDNAGLYYALKSGLDVIPIFIFDKNILDSLENKEDRRVDFIHQCLENLQKEFLKYQSTLLVFHSSPSLAFEELTKKFEVEEVYTNHDYEPYAMQRDQKISDFLKSKGIIFKTFKDQVIFERSEVVKADGKPYTVFTPFSKVWKQKLSDDHLKSFTSEKLLGNLHKHKYISVPSLSEIGFLKTDLNAPSINANEEIIRHYEDKRNFPFLEGTTRLGIHLRFGTISVRKLARKARSLNEQFLNELIWREFFMAILFHFPHVVTQSFKKEYDNIDWRRDESDFKKWCRGETGYPIVDAGMRQLNETGWMHNRVRMIVASFLTKHLLIDWRMGEAYFAEKLIDYELSANNGNWQWAASTGCDAAPYFRIFNPSEQVKKFDPDLKYIRTWVKDLEEISYPQPIVDHKFARERALKTYKLGLQRI